MLFKNVCTELMNTYATCKTKRGLIWNIFFNLTFVYFQKKRMSVLVEKNISQAHVSVKGGEEDIAIVSELGPSKTR